MLKCSPNHLISEVRFKSIQLCHLESLDSVCCMILGCGWYMPVWLCLAHHQPLVCLSVSYSIMNLGKMWMMYGNDAGASVISFDLMNVVTSFASISLSRSSLLLSSLFLVFSDDIIWGKSFLFLWLQVFKSIWQICYCSKKVAQNTQILKIAKFAIWSWLPTSEITKNSPKKGSLPQLRFAIRKRWDLVI